MQALLHMFSLNAFPSCPLDGDILRCPTYPNACRRRRGERPKEEMTDDE